jgi:hypothetical protein
MPSPLPDSVSATLRSDPTAALGALMVIAGAHAELFRWAARAICVEAPARAEPPPNAKGNDFELRGGRPPAARKRKSNGTDAHFASRREARDRDDDNLLLAMRDSPDRAIGDWAEAIGKSRTSVVTALHRLREAGMVESIEGKWALVEPAPRARQRLVGSRPCRRRQAPKYRLDARPLLEQALKFAR